MGVGLDIGSKTIKIVELKKEGNSFKLSGSGIIGFKGIPPDRFKEEKELGDLALVIKKLHKEARISSKDVTSFLFLQIKRLHQQLNGKQNNTFRFQFLKQ